MKYFPDAMLKSAYAELWRYFRNYSARKIIVTANLGGIDDFVIPSWYKENGFLVVIIADQPVSIPNCEIIQIGSISAHSTRLVAKLPKILLPRLARKAELAIWVDSNILFNQTFFSELSDGRAEPGCLTYFDHNDSRSPLLEGLFCMALGKDRASAITKTLLSYVQQGNLTALIRSRINACGILLWKPQTIEARKISKIWFSLVMSGSVRDQISFPLAVRLARAQQRICSWGLPYNHVGEDAPLRIRPHLTGNLPKIKGWQRGLIAVSNVARKFKNCYSRLKN